MIREFSSTLTSILDVCAVISLPSMIAELPFAMLTTILPSLSTFAIVSLFVPPTISLSPIVTVPFIGIVILNPSLVISTFVSLSAHILVPSIATAPFDGMVK